MQKALMKFRVELVGVDAGVDVNVPRVVALLAFVDIPDIKSFFLSVDPESTGGEKQFFDFARRASFGNWLIAERLYQPIDTSIYHWVDPFQVVDGTLAFCDFLGKVA